MYGWILLGRFMLDFCGNIRNIRIVFGGFRVYCIIWIFIECKFMKCDVWLLFCVSMWGLYYVFVLVL